MQHWPWQLHVPSLQHSSLEHAHAFFTQQERLCCCAETQPLLNKTNTSKNTANNDFFIIILLYINSLLHFKELFFKFLIKIKIIIFYERLGGWKISREEMREQTVVGFGKT
ncbi:MAG TPA: hypothetical protein PKH98_01255 [Candidatus Omnitrophota bacterium]|nr:hypothetical protein [Candidatus Omnitrophota bacterium]